MKNVLEVLKFKIAIHLDSYETITAKIINLFLFTVNLIACSLFIINTYIKDEVNIYIKIIEFFIVTIFIIEYAMRLWTSKKRRAYIFSFYGLIDFISILLIFVNNKGFGFLRGLKVLRVLRFVRFLESENIFFRKVPKWQHQFIRTLFSVSTILFIFSGFILYAESDFPNSNIQTFDEAFYYCVTTLSTVGFGDFTPISVAGRWITVIMILTGAVIVPWQVGRLVRLLIFSETGKQTIICTKCGLSKHDLDASHCKACGSIIFKPQDLI